MRPLEIGVVVALLPYVLHLLSPSQTDSFLFRALPFLVVALIAFEVVTEGGRWQMAPVYVLAVALALYECARYLGFFYAPYLAGIAGLLLMVAAIAFSTALPVFRLPGPSGPYRVGTQVRHIVDEK